MNIAIVGSRSFHDIDVMDEFIQSKIDVTKITKVISGGAHGADSTGELFAYRHDIPKVIFKPDWNKYGKKAGFLRNKLIIEAADVVFAFWDGESRGTLSSINLAKEANKELYICQY